MDKCNVCKKQVDERSTHSLCLTCSNQYTDEELVEIMENQ